MTAGPPAMPRREPRRIPHPGGDLPGLLMAPDAPRALLVLAHGAGAGMEHRFMEEVARALAARRIATLRFQFPYTAAGKKRPDPEPVLRGAVAAAVAEGAVVAGELSPDSTPLPLLFLQGDRDALAELDLLRPVLEPLGPRATLYVEEGADHGFHVLKRSGRTDGEVVESLAERAVEWMEGTVPHHAPNR